MSDNQWPFGHRGDSSREPSEEPERAGEPQDQTPDEPAREPAEDETRADTTRVEEEGWGWVDEEEQQQSPEPATRFRRKHRSTTGESTDQSAGRPATRRARFRRWRHSRPFWGALLVLIGGLIVALPPLAAYKIILVAPSVVIASGVGWIVVILGIVSFMTPSQNKLYGLLAILFGGIALVASNLGGFLLGTILTVLGGALTFAWAPLPPEQQDTWPGGAPPAPQEPATAGEGGAQEGSTFEQETEPYGDRGTTGDALPYGQEQSPGNGVNRR